MLMVLVMTICNMHVNDVDYDSMNKHVDVDYDYI